MDQFQVQLGRTRLGVTVRYAAFDPAHLKEITSVIEEFWQLCANRAPAEFRKVVPGEGIEPPTFGLQNRCSTAELARLYWVFLY